ncbi:MAG: lipoyl synthase [Candidatus Hydrogenedentes bacterium]|nr:lipoyl synthase [Candidatus Hydrogenedentota bacterium]
MTSPFPDWIKRQWASGHNAELTKSIVSELGLHTVCQSARCPNQGECWKRRIATFMILGNVCTRSCAFCSVKSGRPEPVDPTEPKRVAEAIRRLGIKHAVVTSVTRDDLPDGGARHFAHTVNAIRQANPESTIEVLVPDFLGDETAIKTVLDSAPEVFSHNIETVERLYSTLRRGKITYREALGVLSTAATQETGSIIKSALMVGHGERPDEVRHTLLDLRGAGCEAVAIGQYLSPTSKQRRVAEFIRPEQFKEYEAMAYNLGFKFAIAGPFVRSSYRSDELFETLKTAESKA